jgi:hypothetical protein
MNAAIGLAVAAAAFAALVWLVPHSAGGNALPPPKYAPLGISEEDAYKLPPEKRKIWEADKQRHETAVAAPQPPRNNLSGKLPPLPTLGPWEPRVFAETQGPNPMLFTWTSGWRGMVNGSRVLANFGARREDPTQGVVSAITFGPDGSITGSFLQTRTKAGALRAVSFTGNKVRLEAANGQIFIFDAEANSVEADSPTATAEPMAASTITPSATPACCSLQLDMDPATPGIQPSLTVSGQQDMTVDVVLGDDVGELGAFDFKLVYDDTRLAPAAGGGGLNGNPDFNEAALGTGWTCGPSPSGEPDIDPATGPGHGVAFISCYVTGQPPAISAPAAVATLRLHFLAAGDASIDIAEANLAHYDATDIGSCNPVNNVEMACAGGSVTGN